MPLNLKELKQLDLRLKGPRLELRPVVASDANNIYLSWLNDSEINQFLETRWHRQDLESILAHIKKINQSPNEVLLKILIADSHEHIGNIKVGPINIHHGSSELSYFIGAKNHWGNGFASEAISLCINFGFEVIGVHKFLAGCYELNIGSKRALEKVGFELEGRWKKQIRDAGGQWQDHLWYGIIRS